MLKIIGVSVDNIQKIVGKSYESVKKIFNDDLPPKVVLYPINISIEIGKDSKSVCSLKIEQTAYFTSPKLVTGVTGYSDSGGQKLLSSGWFNTETGSGILLGKGVIIDGVKC
jgi:hypothetical protein